MADRTSRDTQTRERQERKVWRPGSALEAPEPPLGYKHRWIRESVMEFDDKTNVHKRRQEGYVGNPDLAGRRSQPPGIL